MSVDITYKMVTRAKSLLSGLSYKSSEEIAAWIGRYGDIKGTKYNVGDSPVSNYIRRAVGEGVKVVVGIEFTFLGEDDDRRSMETPGAVKEFIREFNSGRFPDLEKGIRPVPLSKSKYERTTDFLDRLDDEGSVEAVASYLFRAGIKGVPHDSYSCPVANYLKKELGDDKVTAGASTVYVNDELGNRIAIPVPHRISQFIIRFDSGYYDRLRSWE